jgi:FkbM family methyltransferase
MSGTKKTSKAPALVSSTFSCRVLSMLFILVTIAAVVYMNRQPTDLFSNLSGEYHQSSSLPNEINEVKFDISAHSSPKSQVSSKLTETEPSPKLSDQPDIQILNNIKELRRRGTEFLDWVTKGGTLQSNPGYIRWDLIAKADVHIVYNLVRIIDFYLETPEKQIQLQHIYKMGYQCNRLDAMRQELVSKFISMDICSEVEWYKLLHLTWPDANTFLDVGANKGYLGSLFLTLWGGGNLHASPAELYNQAEKQEAWKSSRNPKGYCKDGDHYGVSIYCPRSATRDPVTGSCSIVNPKVRVFSLDGSSYLAQTLSSIIDKFPPFLNPADAMESRASKMWSYQNFAVSDVVGTARFTKQSKDHNPGFEGGGIRGVGKDNAQSVLDSTVEEVPMLTVDHFMQFNNLSHVDLLKIDTEGNDNKVLRGAKKALASSIGMFAFEGGKGVTFSKEMIESLDLIGFSCYSTSRAGLFKWNGRCMKERYMGGFAAKDKGNIFCISRVRAPLAAFAYDLLTFGATLRMMTDPEWIKRQANAETQLQLRAMAAVTNITNIFDTELSTKIDPAFLVPAYINIRGFCAPWPACAKI